MKGGRLLAVLVVLLVVACDGESLQFPVTPEAPGETPGPQPIPAPAPPPQPPPPASDPAPLATWFEGGFSGKTVVVWGNSTVSHGVYFFDQLNLYTAPGELLDGLSPNRILNYGNNGASLAALLAGQGPFPVEAVILAQPDLLIMRGPLINDVRLGGVDVDTARMRLRSALERILAGSPGTAILLTTENSLLATDPGGFGWVQPADAAQLYTGILREAVMSFTNVYPRVAVLDLMSTLYGTVAADSSPWMINQLHPNEAGQRREAELVAQVIGRQQL